MNSTMLTFRVALGLMLLSCMTPAAQSPPSQAPSQPADPVALVKEGRKLNSEGKQDEALALYRQALQASPDLFEAHLAAGIALDLKSQFEEARQHLAKAIEVAPPDSRWQALRMMAVSYAFERNAKEAAKYEQQVFDAQTTKGDFMGGGETANELARIFLESGDLDQAYKWYQVGHATAFKNPNLTPAEKELWDFRWEHAQARVAARRGQHAEAQTHVAAAKAILDKGSNPEQASFYPYLTGYVAFYAGDYKTAITELQKADQRDPFILGLMAQAYENSGDQTHALECYRKVLGSNGHGPTNAFARPLAKTKIASGPTRE